MLSNSNQIGIAGYGFLVPALDASQSVLAIINAGCTAAAIFWF
jgi:hypothetical protein